MVSSRGITVEGGVHMIIALGVAFVNAILLVGFIIEMKF